MNLLNVDFAELYQRHLCRHSQFGINVGHLACVMGTYLGLFGIVYTLTDSPELVLGLTIPYVGLVARNLPFRVLLALIAFLTLFFVVFFALPKLPVWLCLVVIVVLYKVQAWSHKIYTVEKDMTEFNRKYLKGVTLFILLSLYELTLLLNYLCFDRKSWATPAVAPTVATYEVQETAAGS